MCCACGQFTVLPVCACEGRADGRMRASLLQTSSEVCCACSSLLNPASHTQAVFTVLPVRFARAVLAVLRSACGHRAGRRPHAGGLAADQLFDVLCVLIFGATFAVLRQLPAGAIYFWLKDLTQEFLKLHVVHSAVEIFDKARYHRPRATGLHSEKVTLAGLWVL